TLEGCIRSSGSMGFPTGERANQSRTVQSHFPSFELGKLRASQPEGSAYVFLRDVNSFKCSIRLTSLGAAKTVRGPAMRMEAIVDEIITSDRRRLARL